MKKVLFFLISLLIGILLFIWMAKTVDWQEMKGALVIFARWQGFVILALTLLIKLARVFRLKVVLRALGYNISAWSLSQIYLAGRSIAFVAPTMVLVDEAFVAYGLKETHSVPWHKGIISLVINKIFYLTGFFVAVCAGWTFFLLKIGLPPKTLGIGSGILFALALLIFFFYFKCFKKESLVKSLIGLLGRKFENGTNKVMEIEKETFAFFEWRQRHMWKAFAFTFCFELFHFLRCWVLMNFLVKGIGILPVLSVFSFLHLATVIPIPAALGSHEALQVFAFNVLGMKASSAAAFTMIIRGADSLLALVGVIILFQLGIELLKTVLFRRIENFLNNKNNH